MGRVGNEPARYLIKTSRISTMSGELHIADFCLTYLNFGCFNANLTDLEIREFLQQGYYSFEDYTIAHWLDHVESSTSQLLPSEATSLERLAQKIESFFMKHEVDSTQDQSVSTDQRFQGIRQWKSTKRLEGLAQIARQRKSNKNYLDLESQLQRRRSIYEDIVANTDIQNAAVPNFLSLNGPRWFKCPNRWCEFFSYGFRNTESRDKHVNQHERPFRCSFEDCIHAELGYGTEKDLKRHGKTSHPTSQSSEWAFPTKRPKKELDLFSASKKGDLAAVERLVGEGADKNQTSRADGSITALSLAQEIHRFAQALLENGALYETIEPEQALTSTPASLLVPTNGDSYNSDPWEDLDGWKDLDRWEDLDR